MSGSYHSPLCTSFLLAQCALSTRLCVARMRLVARVVCVPKTLLVPKGWRRDGVEERGGKWGWMRGGYERVKTLLVPKGWRREGRRGRKREGKRGWKRRDMMRG